MGCLGTVEQRYLVKSDKECCEERVYEVCGAMCRNIRHEQLGNQNGYKPEQIETSDVSMMSSVMGYAYGKPLDDWRYTPRDFPMRNCWTRRLPCMLRCI